MYLVTTNQESSTWALSHAQKPGKPLLLFEMFTHTAHVLIFKRCRSRWLNALLILAVTWVTIIILCTAPWHRLLTKVVRAELYMSLQAYALMARFNGVTLLGTMPVVVSLALMIVLLGLKQFKGGLVLALSTITMRTLSSLMCLLIHAHQRSACFRSASG